MATLPTSVAITCFCAHSLASKVARAASVARRYLPQKSKFQEAEAVTCPSVLSDAGNGGRADL